MASGGKDLRGTRRQHAHSSAAGAVSSALRRIGRSLYPRLPVWSQHVMVSLEGLRLRWKRYGGDYSEIYGDVQRRAGLAPGPFQRERQQRIAEFLDRARRSRFWRRKFDEHGVSPQGDPMTELSKLPVIDKQVVTEHRDDILTEPAGGEDRVRVRTSGTTGSGLVFETTLMGEREKWATWWRYRSWHGIDRETRCGYFGGRLVVPVDQDDPPYWRVNLPGKQVLFSTFHIKGSTAQAYARRIQRDRLPWLHGYPSALALLGHYVLERDLGPFPSVRIVTTGAESLLTHQREVISCAFGAEVREHYGLAEAVANFSQCEEGRLHVDEDFALVEFLPLSDSDRYRIVGTNWSNPAFPLLRYDTGDVARLASHKCDCGHRGRVVEEVDGRREDYLVLEDGRRLGRLDHIFKGLSHIREAQLHQPAMGKVYVKVVTREGYEETGEEEELRHELDQRLNGAIDYEIRYVDRIERTDRGKLRFVVSEVEDSSLTNRPSE